MTEEWMQIGALVLAGLAVGGVCYAIFRWMRKVDALFPDAAKKYGLTFTRESSGSALTNTVQTSRLRGLSDGTPLEVISTYETRGRVRMRSTVVASKAPAGLPSCTINVTRQPPAAKVHLVPTGDPQFDSTRWVTSDAPAAVRALLTPAVRNVLRQCPQPELRIVVNNTHLVLSIPGTPSNQAELHGPIGVVLAAAKITTA
jgi:hypothetical protein